MVAVEGRVAPVFRAQGRGDGAGSEARIWIIRVVHDMDQALIVGRREQVVRPPKRA